jgi:hypothetical protein
MVVWVFRLKRREGVGPKKGLKKYRTPRANPDPKFVNRQGAEAQRGPGRRPTRSVEESVLTSASSGLGGPGGVLAVRRLSRIVPARSSSRYLLRFLWIYRVSRRTTTSSLFRAASSA